ncbi:hypothetical protein E2562_030092 [Oryza meyeriana var. granulata]|uniref:DUF834 domain-containing protein n=1 Tax=Oryza meyeriana var. granulata TaxID=110450 RepID=A0A6G1CUY5_9ORYZ|nr:hypothetical protein E2562_030092 [Oryza meyeriana var. granulata]
MEIVGQERGKEEPRLGCPTSSAEHGGVIRTCACMEIGAGSKKPMSDVGVIGDGRPAKDGGVDRFKVGCRGK